MCSTVPYVELHLHSAYSFLDGASMPDEIVPAARELGHRTLALTDHNSLSGAMEFAQSARTLGVRAIHGAEIDVRDGPARGGPPAGGPPPPPPPRPRSGAPAGRASISSSRQ
jgi:error-prone DNA polymerase